MYNGGLAYNDHLINYTHSGGKPRQDLEVFITHDQVWHTETHPHTYKSTYTHFDYNHIHAHAQTHMHNSSVQPYLQ